LQNANGAALVFGTNAAEKMRIQSGGNVGIGTAAPASLLHVAGTVQVGVDDTGYDVKFFGATSGSYMLWDESTDDLILGGAAQLGIGTTAPARRIHIESSGSQSLRTIRLAYDGSYYNELVQGGAAGLQFNAVGGLLHTWAHNGTEIMRLQASGLGIGTTAPASLLEVKAAALNRANGISVVGSGGNDILYIYPSADNVATIEHLVNGSTSTGGVLAIHPQGGNVGIGTTSPSANLEVVGTTILDGAASVGSVPRISGSFDGSAAWYFNTNDTNGTAGGRHHTFFSNGGEVGRITTTTSATTYTTSSDYRLKENINYDWDATTRLKQLKPARFNFKINAASEIVDGFLAHEVSSVVPEAVVGKKDAVNEDGDPLLQAIDQSKLVPLLVKALQEQQATIEALTTRITALEG
jgi:hypothetical protein